MSELESIYQEYKDIAVFRLVYIGEAHAADSDWPVPYAKEKEINIHKNYGDRSEVARRLVKDKNLTIPTIIENMDDKSEKAYNAMPNRVFLVRKDGRLGVAAKQGPRGWRPGLREVKKWLSEYKESGKEPELP